MIYYLTALINGFFQLHQPHDQRSGREAVRHGERRAD